MHSPFGREVEVDESSLRAHRIKGKRGRGAYGKTIVFGIFQRKGQGYTELSLTVENPRGKPLFVARSPWTMRSIRMGGGGYNGLVDVEYGKQLRVNHGKDECARGRAHVNGIEGFWGFAKTCLLRFRGINKRAFSLHLKECEFRFNHRGQKSLGLA